MLLCTVGLLRLARDFFCKSDTSAISRFPRREICVVDVSLNNPSFKRMALKHIPATFQTLDIAISFKNMFLRIGAKYEKNIGTTRCRLFYGKIFTDVWTLNNNIGIVIFPPDFPANFFTRWWNELLELKLPPFDLNYTLTILFTIQFATQCRNLNLNCSRCL